MTHQGNGSSIPLTASPDYDQLTVETTVQPQSSEHVPPSHILIEQVEATRSDPNNNGNTTPSAILEFGLARLSVVSNPPAIWPGYSTVSTALSATGSSSIGTNGVSHRATNGFYFESQSTTNRIVSQTTERQGATNGTNSSSIANGNHYLPARNQGATNGIVSQTAVHQGLTNGIHYPPTGSRGATNGIDTSEQEDYSQTAEDNISPLEI